MSASAQNKKGYDPDIWPNGRNSEWQRLYHRPVMTEQIEKLWFRGQLRTQARNSYWRRPGNMYRLQTQSEWSMPFYSILITH